MALSTTSTPDNNLPQLVTQVPAVVPDQVPAVRHRERVMEELRALGLSRYSRMMRAARYLPHIIHEDEHVEGAVAGWQTAMGAVMLLATDRRVVFIVRKLLFVRDDEIGFRTVRGVSYMSTLLFTSVILHTQMGDYTVKTSNRESVEKFIRAIERHGLEGAGI